MAKARTRARTSPRGARKKTVSGALFEHAGDERLDAKSIEQGLASLLALYPEAPVVALEGSGAIVPMPDSIPLQRNPLMEARTGLDLFAPGDQVSVLASWDRVLAVGAARRLMHLADEAATPVTFCGFDVRETHGVILAVMIPSDEGAGAVPDVRELPPAKPRFATINKNENSFVVGISESLTELLGWSEEEMTGHRSLEFIHPDDHPLAIDNWMEMIAAPGPARRVRLRHRCKDGDWVWFEVTNHNLLADPAHACIVAEMVDITEEMSAHQEVHAHEQLLDQLAEAVPLGLFKLDAKREILYTNARLHEIVGVPRVGTLAEQLANVVPSDWPAVEQALAEVLEDGRPADLEVQLSMGESGEPRCCALSLRALSHTDGSINGAIACVSDVTENVRMREELRQRATFDELTGCYNRPAIMRALDSQLAGSRRKDKLAVMFIDLDGFKEVNDGHGHAVGDRLLRAVAQRIQEATREGDLVGRIGGDEFLVVCPGIEGVEEAERLAGRLASTLHERVRVGRATLRPEVSIGIACSNAANLDADTLVAEADHAMYEAKNSHRAEQTAAAAAAGERRSHRAPRGQLRGSRR